MKKILKIAGWSLFLSGMMVLLAFADNKQHDINCIEPAVKVDVSNGHEFVTQEAILGALNDMGFPFLGQKLSEINASQIENKMMLFPGVKDVQVYKHNNGKVNIDILQRTPIARILANNGARSLYIDEDGKSMSLSKAYVAKVPVFTGFIDRGLPELALEEVLQSDSLKKLYVIDDIFEVAKALYDDKFMDAQVVQIKVNDKKEFDMIPRVGNHRIIFGSAENAALKIKKLNLFYGQGIEPRELNNYDTVNVRYINQIICSKR